jgi:rubrerythrin
MTAPVPSPQMTANRKHVSEWWHDPSWLRLSYACPKCGLTTQGVPDVGERCPRCGFRESDD